MSFLRIWLLLLLLVADYRSVFAADSCPFIAGTICTCKGVNNSTNRVDEVTCTNVKTFPKFADNAKSYTVAKLQIKGEIKLMPSRSLDMFKSIDKAIIERTNKGEMTYEQDNFKTLYFLKCTINSLSLKGFEGIRLESNGADSIDPSTAAKLKELIIDDSPTLKLVYDSLTDMVALERLRLRNGMMTNVLDHKYTFGNNTNLVEIDLSRNQLSTYSKTAFESVQKLQTLILDDNKLNSSSLQNATFSVFKNLTTLSLSGLGLKTVPKTFFAVKYEPLTELRLDRCGLTSFPVDLLTSLPKLTSFSVQGNALTTLNAQLFVNCASWKTVNLAGNPIADVQRGFLAGCQSIKAFDLSRTELETIDLSVLDKSAVETLSINDNHRLHLIKYTDVPLPKLIGLTISGGNLSKLDQSVEHLLKNNTKLKISMQKLVGYNCSNDKELSWMTNYYCQGRLLIANVTCEGQQHLDELEQVLFRHPNSSCPPTTKASNTTGKPFNTTTPKYRGSAPYHYDFGIWFLIIQMGLFVTMSTRI